MCFGYTLDELGKSIERNWEANLFLGGLRILMKYKKIEFNLEKCQFTSRKEVPVVHTVMGTSLKE